jgi:hypothetical protein
MASRTEASPTFIISSVPGLHRTRSGSHRSQKKPWQSRRPPSFRSSKSQTRPDPEEGRLSQQVSRQSTQSRKRTPKWWTIRLFQGMTDDVKRRLPYYWSDWRDAWDYRVVPATVYMYFAKYDLLMSSPFMLLYCLSLCTHTHTHTHWKHALLQSRLPQPAFPVAH